MPHVPAEWVHPRLHHPTAPFPLRLETRPRAQRGVKAGRVHACCTFTLHAENPMVAPSDPDFLGRTADPLWGVSHLHEAKLVRLHQSAAEPSWREGLSHPPRHAQERLWG